MRETGRVVLLSVFLLLLAAVATRAENQSQATAPAATAKEPAAAATKEPVPPPSVTVIAPREAHGVLGTVRAAAIDFGGFLGVGSRKIVVDWNALHFGRVNDKSDNITLELSKAQVAAAPEYKEDTPIVVLGAAGNLSPFEYDH
jgi:hypothetical protein